jgi:hypothetical protein
MPVEPPPEPPELPEHLRRSDDPVDEPEATDEEKLT